MQFSGSRLSAGLLMAAVLVSSPAAAFSPASQAAIAAYEASWRLATLIPWGKGAGQLEQQIRSNDPNLISRGPGSILAFEGGSFAVLDTLGASIKEFDASGKPTRQLSFPAFGADRSRTTAIDMASSGPGEYWLLSGTKNVVLHVRNGQRAETLPVRTATRNSLLMAISRDAGGTLYILDGDDGALHRMDGAGHPLPRVHHKDLKGMTIDSKGHVYDLRLAGKTDARHLQLVRWRIEDQAARTGASEPGFEGLEQSGPSLQSTVVAQVESDREVNRMDVFGVDDAGNIYVSWAAGAVENPSRREVVRFDSSGAITGRSPCPADPVELKFTHAKVVSPDGAVLAVRVRDTGLEVLRLEQWGTGGPASPTPAKEKKPEAPAGNQPASDLDFGRP